MTDLSHTARPTRRTVAKGAAWAVPAVAVLGVAPTAAASQVCANNTCFTGSAWKLPGNSTSGCPGVTVSTSKGYVFGMTTTNPTTGCVYVQVTSLSGPSASSSLGDGNMQAIQHSPAGTCSGPTCSPSPLQAGYYVAVPAGTTVNWNAVLGSSTNSSNGTMTITYTAYAQDCSEVANMSGGFSSAFGLHPSHDCP